MGINIDDIYIMCYSENTNIGGDFVGTEKRIFE